MKTLVTLLGLAYMLLSAQEADAFNLSFLSLNQAPIPGDVIMVLLGAGIVGFIGLCRRKFRK